MFQYIENDTSQCRAMAVKYAFEIYAQDQLESRYLLLLASSDPKEEIRQEAGKYLRRTTDPDGNPLKMATFVDWVDFIASKSEERLRTKYKNYTFGTHTIAFDPNCYEEILVILRMAMSTSANLEAQIIEPKALESMRDNACLIVNYVAELSGKNLNTLFKYVNIVKEYALTVANALGIYLLLEICSIAPVNITQVLYENVEWIKNQCFSMNDQVREFSAELWSLIIINNLTTQSAVSDGANKTFDKIFAELMTLNEKTLLNPLKSFEAKHGALLCIGYALGRYLALTRSTVRHKQEYSDKLLKLNSSVISFMGDANLGMAAIVAIGEMARNGQLVFESKEAKMNIIDVLIRKIQTSKETNKLKERAAATLGYLCIHETAKKGAESEWENCNFSYFILFKLQIFSHA